ncbi:delta-like protein [Elysia marginata]|uniref:Delta-like protein n=1 Tax=Elysia marginata TaxID=1093978 RepID=A0AAV4JDS1_9GAST|nr:delta-like protein [Elysia marginata]
MMVGIWYRNFTNKQGALADGTCCDNPGLTVPNCPRDQCDTEFLPCATFVGKKPCGAYFQTPTATMSNKNSFILYKRIGTRNVTSPTLVVMLQKFVPSHINFGILAREVTGTRKAQIANFSFVIDWMDTFFSRYLHWRQMILTDAYSQLGLDVVHQCVRHYFGPTCSVYCKPTHQYTCLNDGSKNCTDGYQGFDCDDLVPYCASGLCQNGGTCNNIHLGYTCICHSSYLGANCETKVTTRIPSPSPTLSFTDSSTMISKATTATSNLSFLTTLKAITATSGLGTMVFNISKKAVSTSTSTSPTAASGPALPVFNVSSKTVSILVPNSASKSEDSRPSMTTIVAVSVSAGLILLVASIAAAAFKLYKVKKQKIRSEVQPSPSPPLSRKESLVTKVKSP